MGTEKLALIVSELAIMRQCCIHCVYHSVSITDDQSLKSKDGAVLNHLDINFDFSKLTRYNSIGYYMVLMHVVRIASLW